MQNVEWAQRITNSILAHYDAHARDLPWRSLPGTPPPDPYHVWLSEIMLQQTTVAAVKPYFKVFTERWKTVEALAAAEDTDVMQAWAGLGYYARARNLLACARVVVRDHAGLFPQDEIALRKLPGIGDYTSAAIASIAFNQRAVVVDGNVERVISRFFAVEDMLPQSKPIIKKLANDLTPTKRAGDFAQAMMDIGSRVCAPKSPLCMICPIVAQCKGKDHPQRYPVKAVKKEKPHRNGTAWWIEYDKKVLLIRRPNKGLLGGMLALPSCDWRGEGAPPITSDWQSAGQVHHIFTHFSLDLSVQTARVMEKDAENLMQMEGHAFWPIDALEDAGLPSLFLKAVRLVMGQRPQ